METIIKTDAVTKLYGNTVGVKDVSLEVKKGVVFGFLGPNGAGKTTLISMLVDLIRPTSGTISLFGLNAQESGVEIRKKVGFLAGDIAFDGSLTGRQQLEYFASLRGGVKKKQIDNLARRLNCNLNKKIRTLSRGNKQKIGLIAALMHSPELLILDEPTSGLDPIMQDEFNKMLSEHKARGGTAFISSHVLSEVQEICDEVAFVRTGKIIAVEQMQDIVQGAPKKLTIKSDDSKLKTGLQKLKGVKIHTSTGGIIGSTFSGDVNELMVFLSRNKIKDVTIEDADLETIFMQHYKGKNDA